MKITITSNSILPDFTITEEETPAKITLGSIEV